MILVDGRSGSKELLPLFPRGKAKLARLEFGDFAFEGNGPEGIPWLVGVERKTIRDLCNCIASGRMSGNQLEGLVNGYNVAYVVVEGRFKADSDGLLVTWRAGKWSVPDIGRTFMLRDVFLFLHTLENVVGIKTWRTGSEQETADWLCSLHQWYTVKAWDEHHGHQQPHTDLSCQFVKATVEQRMLAQLAGVGWKRAKAMAGSGASMGEMCGWSSKKWQEVEGIGGVLGESIVKELWGIK